MSYDATLRIRRFFRGVPRAIDTIGEQALFYGESVRYIPNSTASPCATSPTR